MSAWLTSSLPTAWGMLATPFTADLAAVDHGSLRALVEYLRGQGVDGLIVLGVIGEPDMLSMREKRRVLHTVIEAAGPCPVIATAMPLSRPVRELDLTLFGTDLRHELSAVMIPVTSSDPEKLRDDVDHAARVSGLPIVIQDYPLSTGIHIALSDLLNVVTGDSRIVAVKAEAPPSFQRISELRATSADLHLIAGGGGVGIIEDLAAGADAIACQATPVATLLRAAASAREGRIDAARAELGVVAALVNYEVQQQSSIAIRKEHWRRLGVISHAGVRGKRMNYSFQMSLITESFGLMELNIGRESPE